MVWQRIGSPIPCTATMIFLAMAPPIRGHGALCLAELSSRPIRLRLFSRRNSMPSASCTAPSGRCPSGARVLVRQLGMRLVQARQVGNDKPGGLGDRSRPIEVWPDIDLLGSPELRGKDGAG